MRGLVTAFRTLTILPVPGRDADDLADALPYFPVVGLLLGLAAAGLCMAGPAVGWPAGGALLAIVALLLLTRALHLDGLADMVDALGGGRTRERRLEIMKDPHIGSFGAAAIAVSLLLKAGALARVAALAWNSWLWIAAVLVVSRTAMVFMAVLLPYARAQGGKAAPFVQNARPGHFALAIAIGALLCAALLGPWGLALMLAGLVLAAGLRLWMRAVFGGVTGDLLGATNEITECVLLTMLALLGECLPQLGWGRFH